MSSGYFFDVLAGTGALYRALGKFLFLSQTILEKPIDITIHLVGLDHIISIGNCLLSTYLNGYIWPMLAALRRGPASISRSLQPPSTCSRYSRSILSHKIYQSAPYPVSSSLIQCFSAQRQLGQRAAFAEPEGIENEYRDGTHTQQPSSYSQASEPVHQVPITRFKELEERKLVCPTVVRTLTRDMGLDTMTQVQSLTINETLKGVDT